LEENWDAVDSIDDDSEEDIGESKQGNMPDIKRIFEEKRFLFVEYNQHAGTERLGRVVFWSMSTEDLENHVRPVWQKTFAAIDTGDFGNLPKISNSHICHVRPHGSKGDVLPTHQNTYEIRRSFWLDGRYIQDQIAEASKPSA
jgi:hypothetical protein